MRKWTAWHEIDQAKSRRGPLIDFGIYQIRIVDVSGTPIPIPRFYAIELTSAGVGTATRTTRLLTVRATMAFRRERLASVGVWGPFAQHHIRATFAADLQQVCEITLVQSCYGLRHHPAQRLNDCANLV